VPEDRSDPDEWERYLSAPVANRLVIVALEVLAGMTGTVARLARWGAAKPLLIADGRGVGPVPAPDTADVLVLDRVVFDSLTDQVRAQMHPESRFGPSVAAAVETYDPDGRAVWWVSPVGPNTPLLGRAVLGGRPPPQALLEDKLLLDDLLAAIEGPKSPSAIAPASYDALMSATERVMRDAGNDQVVWAGDARDGTNGGGDYVRWIRTTDQARDAAAFFGARCDKVRVSAFLEGLPCSIHGLCLPDGVVVLRPVELATLRDPVAGRFTQAGMGTSWDPHPDDTREIRRVARAMGELLQRSKGYRGAFGLDGVITVDGFRVNEMNPRFSGGITALSRTAPAACLDLVKLNALIGRDIAKPAAEVEERTLALLDDNRFVDVRGLSPRRLLDETVDVAVRVGEARLERADLSELDVESVSPDQVEGELADVVGSVSGGPSPLGVFVRLTVADDVVRVGDRAAPYGVLLLDFADRMWETGFGRLLMPPDVRAVQASGRGIADG